MYGSAWDKISSAYLYFMLILRNKCLNTDSNYDEYYKFRATVISGTLVRSITFVTNYSYFIKNTTTFDTGQGARKYGT